MMQVSNTFKALVTGGLLMVSTLGMAKDSTPAQQPAPTPEEAKMLDFCSFATLGLVATADMRQSGVSKAEANKKLDDFIKEASKDVTDKEDKQVLADLGKFWKGNVDGLYSVEVFEKEEDKIGFVQYVYNESMNTCIADIKSQNKPTK